LPRCLCRGARAGRIDRVRCPHRAALLDRGARWTKWFIDLGVTFSFAGPIAFATGDTVRRGAAVAPPERTMVETDTPYLNPIDKGAPTNPPTW
jgi:Tat protein secretion system quality control protein TatD with DNase activity